MGVYRAVKIVFEKAFPDRRPFEREVAGIRNYEPISRSHEALVDVLHVGRNEEAGLLCYVMELADDQDGGPNIRPESYVPRTMAQELAQRHRLPFEECLRVGWR